MEGLGLVYMLGVIFVVILVVCWIVLPFAVIGTKPLLRQLLAEAKRTNDILERRLPAPRSPSNTAPLVT